MKWYWRINWFGLAVFGGAMVWALLIDPDSLAFLAWMIAVFVGWLVTMLEDKIRDEEIEYRLRQQEMHQAIVEAEENDTDDIEYVRPHGPRGI